MESSAERKENAVDNVTANDQGDQPARTSDDEADALYVKTLALPQLTISVDEGGDQLSSGQTNDPEELSYPRQMISESSGILQAVLPRPIMAGTYRGLPAYLIQLRFQLSNPNPSRNWLSRIQRASITVVLEDAPSQGNADASRHPSIAKTFPGPNGWQGPLTHSLVTRTISLGGNLGWDMAGINVNGSRSRQNVEKGAVKVTAVRKGRRGNTLIAVVAEDPVHRAGVPESLMIPLIMTHNSRRLSVRVVVSASYGFWRGKLTEMVPLLGRADEPLFFDPLVMRHMMERGVRDPDGERVVKWIGKMDDIDLRKYSSLGPGLD